VLASAKHWLGFGGQDQGFGHGHTHGVTDPSRWSCGSSRTCADAYGPLGRDRTKGGSWGDNRDVSNRSAIGILFRTRGRGITPVRAAVARNEHGR
jgi:hypothetical protein